LTIINKNKIIKNKYLIFKKVLKTVLHPPIAYTTRMGWNRAIPLSTLAAFGEPCHLYWTLLQHLLPPA